MLALCGGHQSVVAPTPDYPTLTAYGEGELAPIIFQRAYLNGSALSNATQIRVTRDQVIAQSIATEAQLGAMSSRAERLQLCDTASLLRLGPQVAQIEPDGFHAADDTEIAVCAPAKLAFIHTYKSGGTTIAGSLHQLCRTMFDSPPQNESGLVCKHNPSCAQSLPEAWGLMANYTWFTFVREPVSKFESGVFELARRGVPCAMHAAADGKAGDELALNILHRCLLGLHDQRPNPHIKPQVDFLLEPNYRATPLLKYVGHIENVTTEWPAIVARFFGAKPAAQVRAALLEDELHARDGTGGEYANNVPGQFRLQITNETVRRHVLRAYKVDEVCLDYEEEEEQETWRLEVERRRPTSVDLQNPGIAPVSLRSRSGAVGSDSEG